MNRFKNILYYADHKNAQTHTLQRVVNLAKANKAALTVVDVIGASDKTLDINQLFGVNIYDIHANERRHELAELVSPYSDSGLNITCDILAGIPFIELIKAVQSKKYDLLVKTAQGQQGIINRIFGSTDMHLLRKCPCPVWIDGQNSVYPYKNILAAVDPYDDECPDLNTLIMDLSTSLAIREAASLHVVHAWQLEGESYLRSPRSRLSEAEVEAILFDTEKKHAQRLNKILNKYDLNIDNNNVSLIKSVPYQGILAKAKDTNADLIVMGTVGRTGLPGFFIGNTAEEVIQNTHCSVLAVKPASFISPVVME